MSPELIEGSLASPEPNEVIFTNRPSLLTPQCEDRAKLKLKENMMDDGELQGVGLSVLRQSDAADEKQDKDIILVCGYSSTGEWIGHAEEREHCKHNYPNTIPVPGLFHATLALYS